MSLLSPVPRSVCIARSCEWIWRIKAAFVKYDFYMPDTVQGLAYYIIYLVRDVGRYRGLSAHVDVSRSEVSVLTPDLALRVAEV